MSHKYTTKQVSRLYSKLLVVPSGCHEWQAYANAKGYGVVRLLGKTMLAHRVVWEIVNGDIPDSLSVCHHCDNPKCCNVDHLFLGTNADNISDSKKKNRRNRPFGEKNGSAKLTVNDVKRIKVLLSQKYRHAVIADMFHVGVSTIKDISRGERWKDV